MTYVWAAKGHAPCACPQQCAALLLQVNPVEWWDGHWLQDRIWSKVPASGR